MRGAECVERIGFFPLLSSELLNYLAQRGIRLRSFCDMTKLERTTLWQGN